MGIYLVMKNNIKRSLNHRIFFIITLLLPIILCGLFGFIQFDKVNLRIGVLEAREGDTDLSAREELYRLLEQSEGISYAVIDVQSSNTDLIMGRYHLLLDCRNTTVGQAVQVISYQSEKRQQLLQAAVDTMIKEKRPLNLTGYKEPGLSITERSLAMILTLLMVFATLHASAYIRDRNNGSLTRYLYAGHDRSKYMLGYCLQTFLITLLQVMLCIISLSLLQPSFSMELMEIILITPVISAVCSLYGIIICHLSNSEVSANIMASSIAGIFSILGGTFVATAAMPGLLRALSLASPVRWVIELLHWM